MAGETEATMAMAPGAGCGRRRHRPVRTLLAVAACAGAVLVAACMPTRFETTSDIPLPLIDKIPVAVGVHLPLEFREQVYQEKHGSGGGEYTIGLGKAQSAGFMRIMEAMFQKVVTVSSPAAAQADPEIRGVLEPVLEDYAFVTPLDSGTQMYAASLKYTVRLYSPKGELAESWTFTGYGSQLASSFPGKGDDALKTATRLAMRDAAAKLAAEFRDQAIARGLLPANTPVAPTEVTPPPEPPRN